MRKLCFVVAVLFVVASCTKKAVPTVVTDNKPIAPKEAAIDGSPLFQQYCERCHGEGGSGGRAPDLTRDDFHMNEVVDKIANGAGRMPAFADKLTAGQIDAVAEFVVHLKK